MKILSWAVIAALFTPLLTACGDDDDDNDGNTNSCPQQDSTVPVFSVMQTVTVTIGRLLSFRQMRIVSMNIISALAHALSIVASVTMAVPFVPYVTNG